jgi:hypothetical protein
MRRILALSVLAAALAVPTAHAADAPCAACAPACEPACPAECGCFREVCKKVCRVVPDVKKTPRNCYSCKCEDFCVLKCSCPLCRHCCQSCQPCSPCDGGCDAPGYCPRCGRPHVRHLLLKKIVNDECPQPKCVVERVAVLAPCKPCRCTPCLPGACTGCPAGVAVEAVPVQLAAPPAVVEGK